MKRLWRCVLICVEPFRTASDFERRLTKVAQAFEDGARRVILSDADEYKHFPEMQQRIERIKKRLRFRAACWRWILRAILVFGMLAVMWKAGR